MSAFQNIKRLVVKVGTSTLTYPSGQMHLRRVEALVKVLSDLKNSGIEILLVSSGAIGVGVGELGLRERPQDISGKQAAAAVGQCALMYMYDRQFAEYGHVTAQVLLTRDGVENPVRRRNIANTFDRLLAYGAIPIINENDTVSTEEIEFGDNDTLSALVTNLIHADLLILLSDIDGLYTDDPRKNPNATLVERVTKMDASYYAMAKESTGSDVGTGGMATKLTAARIATLSGADMIIANGQDVGILHEIFDGNFCGTTFLSNKDEDFYIADYIEESMD